MARLKAEFGQPYQLGGQPRWSLRAADGARTINLAVEIHGDSGVQVRISDPNGHEGAPGRCFPVVVPESLEELIRTVRSRISQTP